MFLFVSRACSAAACAGSSPLENVFLIGQSGQESIRELAATSTDLEQLTHMANMPEVYFFGQRVWENILLSCLAVERADLASKVVERIYCEPAWIDVQARLKSICMSDSIQARSQTVSPPLEPGNLVTEA